VNCFYGSVVRLWRAIAGCGVQEGLKWRCYGDSKGFHNKNSSGTLVSQNPTSVNDKNIVRLRDRRLANLLWVRLITAESTKSTFTFTVFTSFLTHTSGI
jgi:hypothetical protein